MLNKRNNFKLISLFAIASIVLSLMTATVWPCEPPRANDPPKLTEGECTEVGHPIVVADGSVTEYVVDAHLPGKTFGWTHHRSYSSSLEGGTYIQGEKWKSDWFTAFLARNESGAVELYENNVTKRVFTYDDNTGGYVSSDDFLATLTHDLNNKMFVLKLTDTGEQFTFYDLSDHWDVNRQGLLRSRTDRYGTAFTLFDYHPSIGGRLMTVTTSQGWTMAYTYIPDGNNIGRIASIDVRNGLHQVLQRVKYTYYDDGRGYSTDCGSPGDLIMVEVLTRGSADNLAQSGDTYFANRRFTMYRYFRDGHADGAAHQLKMVFSPATMAQAGANTSASAALLLTRTDAYLVAGTPLRNYANITYTYYTSNFDTSSVGTADGGVGGNNENLEDKYGGTNFDETGFARSQTIRKDFGGLLGTRTYFYMDKPLDPEMDDPETPPGLNVVTRIAVEDTKDTGTRRIYGMNSGRMVLRDVSVDDPKAAAPRYWCTSLVRGETKDGSTNNTNQVVESRMPSVHTCIDTLDKLRSFFDAHDDSDWENEDILNASTGIINTYAYNADGFMVEAKVKQGCDGSEYYLRALEYGDGTANKPTYLPIKEYLYPAAVTSKDDPSRQMIEYVYTFHDADTVAQRLKTRTVVYPIVTTGQNGSDVAQTTAEYYDDLGRLRWTQDGEGYVNYYSYNANTGGVGYVMVDVNTDSLPTEITNGSSTSTNWISWSGAVPFTHTDSQSLQLVTKIAYDNLGRSVRVEDAEGMVICTAYGNNQARVYPGWDAGTSTCALPIQVTKTNADDLVTEVYTVDPTGLTFMANNGLPYGNESDTQNRYITWTRYGYNAVTAMLENVDRYHDIPGSLTGTGTMSTNFSRTVYRYDALGRKTHTIQVASGTDTNLINCTAQITEIEYDKLGRAKTISRGVGNAWATLYKVAENFFDETVVGSGMDGIGDGLTTSSLAYYDANHIDASHAFKTIYHYNWQGQLRGVDPGAAPYSVWDVDNMGRVTAVAQYQANLTWSTVIGNDNFAANVASDAVTSAKRGSLTKTYYDNVNRVYRVEIYSVVAGTGVTGDKLVSDYYFNRNDRVVANYSPASGGEEYAYDGAGRQIEARVVAELAATKYVGAAFQYRNPQPGAATGGDDGVLNITRIEFNKVGVPIKSINMVMNHDDTTNVGIRLDSNPKDFIQTFTYNWYDDTHRLITTAYYGSGGASWTYAAAPVYDSDNRPAASDATCLVTNYEYAKGRLEKVRDPKGLFVKYGYDNAGRTVKVEELDATQTVNRVTLTQHDNLSNVVRQVADLNRNGVIDASDQVTTYTYGDLYNASLVTRIQYPDGDAADDNVKFAYNLGGQLMTRTTQKPAGGTANVITFEYDAVLGRPEKQRVTTLGTGIDGTVKSMKYSFDNLGRQRAVTSYSDDNCTSAINEVAFDYTDMGALAAEYQEHAGVKTGGTLAVRYTYAAPAQSMRLTDITYPSGRNIFRDYGHINDLSNKISRLAAIKDNSNNGPTLASYLYNGDGTMVVEDFVQPNVKLDYFGGTSGTYAGFDRFGRVQQQLWRDYGVGADSEKFAYEYDFNSNRKFRQNMVATATGKKLDELYAYDSLDRLVDFKRGKLNVYNTDIPTAGGDRLRGEEWTLTDTGNWQTYLVDATGDGTYTTAVDLNQTRTHNLVNELTGITTAQGQTAWANPSHDSRGNMTSVPQPANMASTYTCAYDAWNRLTKVSDGATTVVEYRYDGLDRRIRTFVPNGQNWTVTEYYYSAAWQVLETRRNSGPRNGEPALASTLYEQYVWSPRYIDSPILRDRSTTNNGNLNERLYYLTDAQMNVTTLVDATGDPVERYTYDPYGNVTIYDGTWTNVRVSSAYANEVLYCGYRLDTETGLYHVRNRVYHPLLGRWIQRDPLGYVDDGLNLYGFCSNAPINRIDPLGLDDVLDLMVELYGRESSQAQERIRFLNRQQEAIQDVKTIAHVIAEIHPVIVAHKVITGVNIDNEQVGTGERVLDGAGLASGILGKIFQVGRLVKVAEEVNDATKVIKNTKRAEEVAVGTKTAIKCVEKAALEIPSPWTLPPTKRGLEIEKMLGGNLPKNFPVIDRFENGIATSIKSVDLAAESYQDIKRLERLLVNHINSVREFKGRNFAKTNITSAMIKGRSLEVAIPRGVATEAQREVIKKMETFAPTRGVTIKFTEIP